MKMAMDDSTDNGHNQSIYRTQIERYQANLGYILHVRHIVVKRDMRNFLEIHVNKYMTSMLVLSLWFTSYKQQCEKSEGSTNLSTHNQGQDRYFLCFSQTLSKSETILV